MINHITLKNAATFENASLAPNKINFVFGSNGTGKTTLSRVIGNSTRYNDCALQWENGKALDVFVFNRDFINANIEAEALSGVFTLGDGSIKTKSVLEKLSHCLNKLAPEANKLLQAKAQQEYALQERRTEIKETCWQLKKKYETKLPKAFSSYGNSKEKFLSKILEYYPTYDAVEAGALTEQDLISRYNTLHGDARYPIQAIKPINITQMSSLETFPLLEIPIVGASTSSFGEYIKNMNISDWVRVGIAHINPESQVCPLCQQVVPEATYKELIGFFDKKYEQDCKNIYDFYNYYVQIYKSMFQEYETRLQEKHDAVSFDSLKIMFAEIQSLFLKNQTLIEEKINTPSKIIKIHSMIDLLSSYNNAVEKINTHIQIHNRALSSLAKSKKALTSDVFKYFLHDKITEIKIFKQHESSAEKALENISKKLGKLDSTILKLKAKIGEKSASIVGIQKTILSMNAILKNYGFDEFELDTHDKDTNSYKIIRKGTECVKSTLSEGEKNFITFLYFYHVIQGSLTNAPSSGDKVIVIDDPASSLDSNTMFIVTSLIKDLIQRCATDSHTAFKQVFILTHNTFFYHEVSHCQVKQKNKKWKSGEITHFIIRKSNARSEIQSSAHKTIKTYYELLWDEVRAPNPASKTSLFNAMRRIIEHYFRLIGEIDDEQLINSFDANEQILVKALLASQHAGSHGIPDDFMFSPTPEQMEVSIAIFKKIFDAMGHTAHYEMMMSRASDAL